MPRPPRPAHVPTALDVAAFCRDGARLEGRWDLAELARLADGVLRAADGAADAPVEWSAAGAVLGTGGGTPRCAIELVIRAVPLLECQRCLQPMALPLDVRRRILFVHGEDEAARLDEELDDDVLALAKRFDLKALIEDELLLALPLVPRHEACPDLPAPLRVPDEAAAAADVQGPEGPNRPFAVLAALRGRRP